MYWKTCESCGKELIGKKWGAKYCGATCRKRGQRKRENHEQDMRRLLLFIEILEPKDLVILKSCIDARLPK